MFRPQHPDVDILTNHLVVTLMEPRKPGRPRNKFVIHHVSPIILPVTTSVFGPKGRRRVHGVGVMPCGHTLAIQKRISSDMAYPKIAICDEMFDLVAAGKTSPGSVF